MKVRLNWRKLTALSAVLTLALLQCVSLSRATASSPPPSNAPSDVRLDSELRVLDSFLDDWVKVYKQQTVLSRKASVSHTEFDSFKSSSENIKSRCSDFQRALRDVIKKLKDADRWNGLDDEVLAKTADDQKLRSELRDSGGLKRLLEDASSTFCSQAEAEITSPIESLRPKLSSQVQDSFVDPGAPDYRLRMVRANYNPTPFMFTKGVRCIGATIRVAVHLVFTGTSGPAGGAHGNRECFCFDNCSASTT